MRSRAENFTTEEKDLLVELVTKYKEVIENKRTDAVSQKQKKRAYQMLSNEYNSQSTRPRTAASLKVCWENIKKRSRKAQAKEKASIFKTGR